MNRRARPVCTTVAVSMFLALPLLAQDDSGPPDDRPDGMGPPIDARTQLERPDPAVDEDANGDVRLREHRGRSSIHVHVRHLDQGAVYDVAIARDGESEPLGSITIVDGDGDKEPAPRCFEAALTVDQEVPPVAVESEGSGHAKLVLTGRDRLTLRYQIVVEGLTGPPTGAHIHMGAVGEAGEVVHTLDHETLRGTVELTEEDLANLEAGLYYVNVHTEANPPGEVRGQIGPCADDDGDDGDDGDGDDDFPPDRSGNGMLRIDTMRGDSLPLGAESVADLVGTTVSVSNADGAVVLSGEIVDLEKHKFGRGRQGPPDRDDGDNGNGDGGDGGGASLNALEAGEPVFDELLFVVVGRHDASFLRGDANMDGGVDISDPIRILDVLFRGGRVPVCLDAADANDDGSLDISDPIAMLLAQFQGASPLPYPSDLAGFDATGDRLFCEE